MDDRSPSMLKSTLIAGLPLGFAGGLPIIGALNCACCSLVIGAGFLAAYLYSRQCVQAGVAFAPGGGARVGLVSGLFYAIGSTISSALVRLVYNPDMEDVINQLEDSGLPPEAMDMIAGFMRAFSGPMGIVLGFLITLLLGAVFATLGGLIAGAVFKIGPRVSPPAPPPTFEPPAQLG